MMLEFSIKEDKIYLGDIYIGDVIDDKRVECETVRESFNIVEKEHKNVLVSFSKTLFLSNKKR